MLRLLRKSNPPKVSKIRAWVTYHSKDGLSYTCNMPVNTISTLRGIPGFTIDKIEVITGDKRSIAPTK